MSLAVAHRGGTPRSRAERLLAAALAVIIVLGSAVVWIGVPVAGFWAAGRLTTDAVTAVLFALLAIPLTMVAVGWALYRVNARYEDLRRGGEPPRRSPPAWRTSLGEERASTRRRAGGRTLIDVSMTVSCVTALLVLTIWFFFFAELRLSPLP
jgi:hypothetical protein